MILTEGQIKAQVRAIRKKANRSAVAFALRSDGPWSGPTRLTIDNVPHRVAFCRSDLELRELLRSTSADNEPLVALCPFGSNQLGEDVLARLAKRRVHPPDSGEIIGTLFQATSVDSRILSCTPLANALVEHAPSDGYPPVAGGVLDLQTAWCELLGRALGDREVATSIVRLLEATLDAGFRGRLEKMPFELRREFFNWAALNVDRSAAWMAYLVNDGRTSDLISLGLLLELAFDPALNTHAEIAAARVRPESWFGGHNIDAGAARSWAAAARSVIQSLRQRASSRPLIATILSRFDALLAEFKISEAAAKSDFSPIGFEQRVRLFAGILAQTAKPAAVPGRDAKKLIEAIEALQNHLLAGEHQRRIERCQMADRPAKSGLPAARRTAQHPMHEDARLARTLGDVVPKGKCGSDRDGGDTEGSRSRGRVGTLYRAAHPHRHPPTPRAAPSSAANSPRSRKPCAAPRRPSRTWQAWRISPRWNRSRDMNYDVFLSHSTADKPFVRALADWLRRHDVTFFLDEKDLQPGDRLTEKLGTAMEASRSAIICIGPHGEGPWQAEEIDSLLNKAIKLSRKLDEFRIIPVLLPGADTSKLRWFLETRLWVNLSKGITDGEAELFRLRHAITGTAADAPIHDDPTFNPYRGLKAFEEKDAAFFFGRARECRVLAAMIEEWRFACIVGPSGNGKSSLARAGLATDGAEAACPGIRGWTRISAVPGGDLLRAIMVRLFAGLPEGERAGAVDAAVKRAIPEPGKWTAETWASGLDHELKAGFPDPQQGVLILVDQFEEIFTHRGLGSASDEERQARIRIILDALALIATCDDKRWRFVFTLRADFFQRCRVSDSFWKLVSADRLNLQLDELDEEGWREAIKGPAARAGAYLEAGLVETMLKDVYRQRGSMPLLQLALHQLWRLRQGACLTHAAYSTIGGVANALQNRAETALSHLGEEDPEFLEIARNLFLRLTSPGEGVSDTRRRLDRSELAWENTESKKVDHVLADLSGPDNRLLVADDHSIEVTHEVLIRDCDIIRGWIERDRKDIPVLRRLTHAAQRWAGNNRDAIFLNAADPPRELKQWMKKTPLRLTDLEREYWKASRADRTRALQEKRTQRRALLESERGRANEAVRQACTRQRFLIAVVVVSLAAIGVFAYFNHRANVEKARALELIRFMDAQVGQAFVDAVPVQLRERVSARVDAFYTEQGGLTAVGDHERMGYYLRKAQVHLAAVDRYQKDATFNEDAKGVYIGWERASAADALRESLRLGESLARKIENKADRSVTRDRILAHFHLSALFTQLEDSDGAGEHLKAARALLDAMVQDGPFSAVQLADWMDLPNLDAAMGDHAAAARDQKSAQGWYQKALALQTALVALRPTDQAQAQKSEETRVSIPKTREEVLEEIQAHLKKTAP